MKAFVTGVGGQLGHDVMDELAKRGFRDSRMFLDTRKHSSQAWADSESVIPNISMLSLI